MHLWWVTFAHAPPHPSLLRLPAFHPSQVCILEPPPANAGSLWPLLGLTGRLEADLHRLEVQSHPLIQLEGWLTATGQKHVTIVGPPEARQWRLLIIWSMEVGPRPARPRWTSLADCGGRLDGGVAQHLGFFKN